MTQVHEIEDHSFQYILKTHLKDYFGNLKKKSILLNILKQWILIFPNSPSPRKKKSCGHLDK